MNAFAWLARGRLMVYDVGFIFIVCVDWVRYER